MPKHSIFVALVSVSFLVSILNAGALPPKNNLEKSKKTTSTDQREKSLQAFVTVLKVIKSERCINCHPTGDVPRQGNDGHFHRLGVNRGADNHGGVVQQCKTCHHEENMPYTNVPGAPRWGVAPKMMGWFGLSDNEIAKALMDKSKNGGRTAEALAAHMSDDPLVQWAWQPGHKRTPPPVPVEEFRKALQEWLATGAHVPTK